MALALYSRAFSVLKKFSSAPSKGARAVKSVPFTSTKVAGVMVFCSTEAGSLGSMARMEYRRSNALMMEWRKLALFTAISQFSGPYSASYWGSKLKQ